MAGIIGGGLFQSTLSMRRATCFGGIMTICSSFQSTLSMRRATTIFSNYHNYYGISIHALHEESDAQWSFGRRLQVLFQSTLSMRRATHPHHTRTTPAHCISIHALHEESDLRQWREEINRFLFQSTLSMRRATKSIPDAVQLDIISIHALHEESDRATSWCSGSRRNFNPRSP